MAKFSALCILLSLFSLRLVAQSSDLDCSTTGRYVSDVFTSVSTTTDIVYGHNAMTYYTLTSNPFAPPPYTYSSTTADVVLSLDMYQPSGDMALRRPLVVLAFGGSYAYNNRTQMADRCIAFAKKGYVAVTIDYRKVTTNSDNFLTLYYHFLDPASKAHLADEVVKTSADMKAAIRFMKENANTYKIDTTKIFVGGYSSGAITALQTAYVEGLPEVTDADILAAYNQNGGIEGNTDNGSNLALTHTFRKMTGVMNIAGGLYDLNWITADNPPIYSMHGDQDGTVPFNYGHIYNYPNSIQLYGSNQIKIRADNIGLLNVLNVISGGDHSAPQTASNQTLSVNNAATFFQQFICPSILPVTLSSFSVQNDNCTALLRWQTATESKSNRYEVEVSTNGSGFIKVGAVASKNSSTGAAYSYNYKGFNGTSFFRLKMVDADGNFTYSSTQKLDQSCGTTAIQVYPNPAKDQTLITGLKTGQQVQLINAQGQRLWMQKAGGSAMQVPLAAFTSGLYLVQIADATGKIISNNKLVKE